jgi:predicted RNA-binding Zn-ribbon protein involved in translation (DUF1610 family)
VSEYCESCKASDDRCAALESRCAALERALGQALERLEAHEESSDNADLRAALTGGRTSAIAPCPKCGRKVIWLDGKVTSHSVRVWGGEICPEAERALTDTGASP